MDTNKLAVPLAIVIAGLLIAGSVYLSSRSVADKNIAKGQGAQPTQQVTGDVPPVSADDHILGNPNADVVIIEYSDTECPFCKVFHATLRKLISEYGPNGQLAWVYRHFPISQLHSKAPKEAEALECANDLGGPTKFWDYTNEIYDKTTSNNTLDPAILPQIAKDVGLDVTAFNKCLSSGKFTAKVQASYAEAVKIGARGTPYSILITKDGSKTPIEGAVDYASLKATMEGLLKK